MATRSVNGLLTSVDSLFTTQQERDEANLKKIYDIPLSEIDDFPEHPYQLCDDKLAVRLRSWSPICSTSFTKTP